MGYHEKQLWRKSSIEELGCLFRKQESAYRYETVFDQPEEWENSISTHWRHKICDWYYEFIDHYNFDREVVGIAISYFDRYISSQKSCEGVHNKDKYQVIAVTSLFLAIKLHSMSEDSLVQNRSFALARLLYGHVDPDEIYKMEMDILQVLDWRLNPPTLHQFALNFSQLHPLGECCSSTTSYLYEATRYQVELAIFIPALLAKFSSSVIVYAALKNTEEKIASEDPDILTEDMKQSFEALMEDPSIAMDRKEVAKCQISLKRLCPQLPGLDYFGNDSDVSVFPSDYNVQGADNSAGAISPLNVVDY